MSNAAEFIGRNRPPRVQIQYEVETWGKKKMVELPFIVGVMSDLSGKSESTEAKKALADRKFNEINIDNFDARMEKLAPKVAFQVRNTLTGDGQIPVAVEFKSMEDFNPANVARQIDPMAKLLETRRQLEALKAYTDGKADADALLGRILDDPALLKAIADSPLPAPAKKSEDSGS